MRRTATTAAPADTPGAAGRGVLNAVLLAASLGAIPGVAAEARAQDATLARARAHYEQLSYDSAIAVARRALAGSAVNAADRIALQELLGFAFASVDSATAAVTAFRELIQLAPDREPDPQLVSPKITTLYAQALGQVLVVRRLTTDSTSFVAGEGAALIRFQLTRAAMVRTRVVGPGFEMTVDSQSLAGSATIRWDALTTGRRPVPAGRYQVIVTATAGREEGDYLLTLLVAHAALDTLPHVTSLPGYQPQPETEQPQRDWTPLARAAAYVAAGVAATLALRNVTLGQEVPTGVLVAGGVATSMGFALSLRRPAPRTVPTAVQYNRLLRDFIARRNEDIARDNAASRTRVNLTITMTPAAAR